MKTLLLVLVAAVAALAQVPAQSTVGTTTIYVKDITIPVPYGPDETRALVTACVPAQVTYMNFSIEAASQPNYLFLASAPVITQSATLGYCASVLAPVSMANISQMNVEQTIISQVAAPTSSGATPQVRKATLPAKVGK